MRLHKLVLVAGPDSPLACSGRVWPARLHLIYVLFVTRSSISTKTGATPSLWQHKLKSHLFGNFPPRELLREHDHLMCSTGSCHWVYHSRLRRLGCQRPSGNNTKCGGALLDPADIPTISWPPPLPHSATHLDSLTPPSGPTQGSATDCRSLPSF